ncbi:MAG: hypothetical protein ABRQ26_06710 [Syntrophomonadaceae bacterium]
MSKFRFSDLIVEIEAPEWVVHKNLLEFSCSNGDPDVRIQIIFEKLPRLPLDEAMLIVKTSGKSIYDIQGSVYSVCGYEYDIPSGIIAAKDRSFCTMYVDPEFSEPVDETIVHNVSDGIFCALREVIVAVLARKYGLIIHSSTIVWNAKGVVFSAPSGTGKSTHAHLWQQRYQTPILDGDATACRIIEGIPVVYGLPWCGTSGEFMNQSAPLGAIVFLEQAEKNEIEKLNQYEAFMRLAARSFLLRWDVEAMDHSLNTVQEIVNNIDCYLLKCLPDYDAVELVKKCLDQN